MIARFTGLISNCLQAFASLQRYTAVISYSSNMAAVNIVPTMMSLSPRYCVLPRDSETGFISVGPIHAQSVAKIAVL